MRKVSWIFVVFALFLSLKTSVLATVFSVAPTCNPWESIKINNCSLSAWNANPRSNLCKVSTPNVPVQLNSNVTTTMSFANVAETTNCATVPDANYVGTRAYSATTSWNLAAGLGVKKVCVKLTNSVGSAKCGVLVQLVGDDPRPTMTPAATCNLKCATGKVCQLVNNQPLCVNKVITLGIFPTTVSTGVGKTFDATLRLNSNDPEVGELTGSRIIVNYDANKLTYVGNSILADYVVTNTDIAATRGKLVFSIGSRQKTSNLPVNLIKVTFRAMTGGSGIISSDPLSVVFLNKEQEPKPVSVINRSLVTITGSLTPTPMDSGMLGDANNDNKVDLADFAVWKKATTNTTDRTSFKNADFNNDNRVDQTDFDIWKGAYLKAPILVTPTPTAILTPTVTPALTGTVTPVPTATVTLLPTPTPSIISCVNFSDDFSGTTINGDNWDLWSNGGGGANTNNGNLVIDLPVSADVAGKMALVQPRSKPLAGNFTSEITLVSRNDNSTYEYFQFNDRPYDGMGVNGFGFRIVNGSLATEVYGADNPTNPGATDHLIAISSSAQVKLKLERVGSSAKMSLDKMDGQGYQVIRVFDNFNTNPGYVSAGVQHTGSANLALSGVFDNYQQTCVGQ